MVAERAGGQPPELRRPHPCNVGPICVYTHMSRDRPTKTELDEMASCACLALRKATRIVTQFYDSALRPHGLRATQCPILVVASRMSRIPLALLAEQLGMERTTLLRNVRPLARRGLLEVGVPDGSRRTELRITPEGRALVARVYPVWKRAQTRMLRGLQGAEWGHAQSTLAMALENIEDGPRTD